jgi:hypothetical protein
MELEVVSAVPHKDPPAQRSQSSPEHSRSTERESEAETVVTWKGQDYPDSEAPEDKSLATDTTPSFDLEAPYLMALDFGKTPEFKIETVVTSKSQGVPDSEATEDKSLAASLAPPFSLEDYFRLERKFGRMSEFDVHFHRYKMGMRYRKNYIAEIRASHRDCRTALAKGLLGIPLLLRDAITGNGCRWLPKEFRDQENVEGDHFTKLNEIHNAHKINRDTLKYFNNF